MFADLIEIVIYAASGQLLMEPPPDRVFSSLTVGCAYYVLTGDPAYLTRSMYEKIRNQQRSA